MRIAIAGAGNVGRAIARELLDNGHQVLLIDKDPKALKLESVPDAEWLMADACEITSLDNAHLDNCQVLVAATGDDKANLVTSLLARLNTVFLELLRGSIIRRMNGCLIHPGALMLRCRHLALFPHS